VSRLHECMLVTSTVHACQADGSKSLLARAAPLHFGWRTARECASPWPPRLAARLKSLHLSLCSSLWLLWQPAYPISPLGAHTPRSCVASSRLSSPPIPPTPTPNKQWPLAPPPATPPPAPSPQSPAAASRAMRRRCSSSRASTSPPSPRSPCAARALAPAAAR